MPSGDKIEAHFCSPKMASHVHVWHTVRPYCEVMWGQGQGYLQVRGGVGGVGFHHGARVAGLQNNLGQNTLQKI